MNCIDMTSNRLIYVEEDFFDLERPSDDKIAEHAYSSRILINQKRAQFIFSPPSLLDISYRLGFVEVSKYLLKNGVLPSLYDEDAGMNCNAADSILAFAHAYNFFAPTEGLLKNQLLRAVHENDIMAAKVVLSHGLHPDCLFDKEGRTPLYISILKKHVPIAKLLLQAKADPNKADKLSIPMLVYLLLKTGRDVEELIELLLRAGVNLTQTVKSSNQSLLEFARSSCPSAAILQLIEKFAENTNQI